MEFQFRVQYLPYELEYAAKLYFLCLLILITGWVKINPLGQRLLEEKITQNLIIVNSDL